MAAAFDAEARTADRPHGPGHVPTPLSPTGTEDGQDQGGEREELHGKVPALPQAAGAVYYEMDTGEDDGSAPAAMRPAPLFEVLPQEGTRRLTECGFELALDPVVPQLGRDVRDWLPTMELVWWEQLWRFKGLPGSVVINRMVADIPSHYAAFHQRARAAASGSRSSNKVGGRKKKKKRRKKKVPKSFPSHSSRRDVGVGRCVMHDRAEDEFGKEAVERADVLTTDVSDTLHAEPLTSAHSKGRTCTVTARTCTPYPQRNAGLTGGKIVGDTYGDWGTHQSGQVCCLLLQMAKSVVKSKLSKHYLPRR